ncbi:MAG TPA: hypothetical protein DDZ51_27695 [Planctomycetaceae bacterium]|nr:hypothetical protein [Planctomycetaceae bacterium]
MASRTYRAPDVKDLLDESLMLLVRGTDDPNSPFYGEDLLSDYYGRRDSIEDFNVANENITPNSLRHVGGGYVQFVVNWSAGRPINQLLDDLYTGRLITFLQGPLENTTFRVVRSRVIPPTASTPPYDALYIHLDDSLLDRNVVGLVNQLPVTIEIRKLLYGTPDLVNSVGNSTVGFSLHMNGIPRNSPGIGFAGTNLGQTINPSLQPLPLVSPPRVAGLPNVPVSFQPNKLPILDNHLKNSFTGDFDEDYDAADFSNWFLSFTNEDGTVIPSFHRPAVINYLLNEMDWTSADAISFSQALASISRATFRPLPIGRGEFGNLNPIHPLFSGGSKNYALRTPVELRAAPNDAVRRRRFDQLARALIRDSDPDNQWDVDNSGDGKRDSIWMDVGLPVITSPEGKLIKPLIATRIEDLSGRLNLNAHDNVTTSSNVAGVSSRRANWAGTRGAFDDAANNRSVFQGIGYGPAEIRLPPVSDSGIFANFAPIQSLIVSRYASPGGFNVPGRPGADVLDTLRFGWRPPAFTAGSGYGASMDPFGRGGVAIGRSGHLVAAISGREHLAGTNPPLDRINEVLNDPYESDPSGNLSGDSPFHFSELEPLLRARDFDIELLPQRLRGPLFDILRNHPELANVFTTYSTSDDSPVMMSSILQSTYRTLVAELGAGLSKGQIEQLLPPELRLNRKFDVNRPFGNGVDDDSLNTQPGFGIVDEPRETAPGVLLPTTAGSPLGNVATPAANVAGMFSTGWSEVQAYGVSPLSGQAVPVAYNAASATDARVPRYTLFNGDDEAVYQPTNPGYKYPFDIERLADGTQLGRQLTSRQLYARHLYVLMMLLTRDYNVFPSMASTFDPPRTEAAVDFAFLKARRIAQWAVNVVDYRDPDSIMTRFVFDPNPFDGWSPPSEQEIALNPLMQRNVVWGVESPELIFSESLAFHDVRVRSTNRANTTGGPRDGETDTLKNLGDPMEDQSTDQVRKPEGSLFLELYCARSQVIGNPEQSTKPGVPRELYNIDLASGVAELDLDREAPPRPGANRGAPVWRIAISERHDATNPNGVDPNLTDPQRLRESYPDSFSPETAHPDELGPARPFADQLKYDRYIWFRSFANRNEIETLINSNAIRGNENVLMEADAVFFAPEAVALNQRSSNNAINTMRQLQPGQFLSLAPREVTYIGSTRTNLPSTHRFEIIDNDATNPTDDLEVSQWGVVQFNQNNQRTTPLLGPTNHHTASLPMIIGAIRPAGWNANSFENGYIGLNISEPLANAYYPPTTLQYNGATNNATVPQGVDYPLFDAYLDLSLADNTARDIPADVEFNANRIPNDGNDPILGTLPNYCTAFLQRLADPTVPYDPLFNPYRTIDWLTIDLTVFSGEEVESTVTSLPVEYALRSRQRNGFIGMNAQNALFSNETNEPIDSTATILLGGDDYFTVNSPLPVFSLQNSLSFLNTDTSASGAVNGLTGQSNPGFQGFSSSIGSDPAAANVVGNDRNLPNIPYAVHPWLNRPFATHFELMMVPASSAGRLFEEFSINASGGNPGIYPSGAAVNAQIFYGPFRHLLNFFHSHRTTTSGLEAGYLFDLIHTLPRFKGEVDVIEPSSLNLQGTNPAAGNDAIFRSSLRPPFSISYNNQRIGKINLNSISDFTVWAGLMQGHMNQAEFGSISGTLGSADQLSYENFVLNRRGYANDMTAAVPLPATGIGSIPLNYDPANLHHRYPTNFLGAFRTGSAANLFPSLRNPAAEFVSRRRSANSGLLRMNVLAEADNVGATAGMDVSKWVRAFSQLPDQVHENRDRNAFVRYQTLMRMPNLVADNSQMFLIRTTMGFFEIDTNGNLGREYNEELGQNQRHKATYVIDRSKEVGFIPGRNLNARNVVLYESYSQ